MPGILVRPHGIGNASRGKAVSTQHSAVSFSNARWVKRADGYIAECRELLSVRKHTRIRGKLHSILEKLDHGHHVLQGRTKSSFLMSFFFMLGSGHWMGMRWLRAKASTHCWYSRVRFAKACLVMG